MLYPTSTSSSESIVDASNLVDQPSEQRAGQARTKHALWHLVAIAFTLTGLALATYTMPSLERVRPWMRGEGVPVVRLFTGAERVELPQFEGGATAAATPRLPHSPHGGPSDGVEDFVILEDDEDEGDDEQPLPAGRRPPAHDIAPAEYGDVEVPIENPEALQYFFAALQRTAQQRSGAITRVAHYGDSAIAADEISQTLRRRLQRRFGDAGHGFMLAAGGDMHYVHRDVSHSESDGWELSSIVRRGLKTGLYGYGGVVARATRGEYATFGTTEKGPIGRSVSRFEIYFQRSPSGGELRLLVDGEPRETVSTRGRGFEDGFHVVEVPDGPHSLTLRTSGEVRVYGVVQERDEPGVVYDALGMVGARADRLLDADPEHMASQIARRKPDLIVLGFGGNEAGNDWLDPEKYARSLKQVLKLMRAGKPESSCLLFAPLDQGQRTPRGRIITLSVLPAIVLTQREVAKEEGCAFFDTWSAMGGEGAMARWYAARPRLVSSDLRHATPRGYAILGTAYYKALIKSYADYVADTETTAAPARAEAPPATAPIAAGHE